MSKVTIEGKEYYTDSSGRLVPAELMKPQEIVRDELVTSVVEEYFEMRKMMQDTKRKMLDSIEHFKELQAVSYGVEPKSKKGNLILSSVDGKYRIIIAGNTSKEFNENISVAKDLLDEYLDEELASAGASEDLRILVTDAFRLRQGELDFRSVWNLTKLNIKSEKFQKAVEIIKDSIVVRDLNPSLRVYVKNKEGSFEYFPADFATLSTIRLSPEVNTETKEAEAEPEEKTDAS